MTEALQRCCFDGITGSAERKSNDRSLAEVFFGGITGTADRITEY